MVIENINEVPHINLDLQKFPNITDKKANKNQIQTNIWSNAPYGWPIPWKKCFFSGIIRKCSRVKQVEHKVGNTAVGRDIWYASADCFSWIILTLGNNAFANSGYPENWALLYEALSMLATKKNRCSQGNCTLLSTLNKKFLSVFNFIPKMSFYQKSLPFHTPF